MTACEACRAAKVKCDGQQRCGRCAGRDINCRYTGTNIRSPRSLQQNNRQISTEALPPQTHAEMTPDEISTELETDPANLFDMENVGYEQAQEAMVDWQQNAFDKGREAFDWNNLGNNLDVRFEKLIRISYQKTNDSLPGDLVSEFQLSTDPSESS